METVRGLLTRGNSKIGEGAHIWSLPAVTTCPGMSEACRHCYAQVGRYRFPAVIERLDWNLTEAKKPGFSDRMIREVKRKGCLAVRVHASGDAFSPSYAKAWSRVFSACPNTKFWGYSRSWRDAPTWEAMKPWASFKNVRLWASADRFTGMPTDLPPGVRVAWLLTESGEVPPSGVHLVFRIRGLRKESPRIGLRVLPVCPNELGINGKRDEEVTCGSCQRCLR